jgi:hypothetical protein
MSRTVMVSMEAVKMRGSKKLGLPANLGHDPIIFLIPAPPGHALPTCGLGQPLRHKLVTRAADRLETGWIQRIRFELLAQFHDVIIDSARGGITVVTPNLVQ